MNRKLRILVMAVVVLCLPLKALAEEHTFKAGSLIIPMDSQYQPAADGGLLEAYGLVYYLLKHKDANGKHDITVYWVINQGKTAIDGDDLVIEDNTLEDGEHVVKLYNHNQGVLTFPAEFPAGSGTVHDYKAADNKHRISYKGGVFILDVEGQEAVRVKEIIDGYYWLAVEVHEAQVPFSAPVFRKMIGAPPKIALMNNVEDKTGGNVAVLESYLRLAGLCTECYGVVTPNEVRDGILRSGEYDFLWAPHWDGDDRDGNENGSPDVEDVVNEVKLFVESGKGVLAECASIAEFEDHGRFLTNYGFGHNGGTNEPNTVQYINVTSANAQIGDFAYEPEGGSLRNFRPYVYGDPIMTTPASEVTEGNPSIYNATVSRFAADNTGWDYTVGGYAYGDTNSGYVVYLGGHSYASCKGSVSALDPDPGVHHLEFEFKLAIDPDPSRLEFEFERAITDETFTLVVTYDGGYTSSVTFNAEDLGDRYDQVGDPLQIDLRSAKVEGNKLQGIILRNKGASAAIDVNSVDLSWTGGDAAQRIRKLVDQTPFPEVTLYDSGAEGSPFSALTPGFFVESHDDPQEFTVHVKYNSGSQTEVTFSAGDLDVKGGDPLEVDVTTARIEDNKLKGVVLRNRGASTITVNSITVSWPGPVGHDYVEKLTRIFGDKTDELYDGPEVASGIELAMTDFPIEAAGGGELAGCTNNDDCSWRNIAGVRYALNTVFSVKYQLQSTEYVRSTPIVNHPYLYQGSFEYPSYLGHFRKYDVTKAAVMDGEGNEVAPDPEWDTADAGHIADANTGNADGRKVYTAELLGDGAWSKTPFDATSGQIIKLNAPLGVTPGDGDTSDEEAVITRVRGKRWDRDSSQWVERSNKLGGIMHSAPAIVNPNSRAAGRDEVAYVGDLYGMLHAIETATGNEKWAFIPNNLLGKLKNDRTDPNAVNDFAAVDGSPTVADVYYDHDSDPNTGDDNGKSWRSILVCSEGWGGNHLFALDVTDPDSWSVLWELTVEFVLSYYGSGGFTHGAAVIGQTSGATAQVVYDDAANDELTLKEVVGQFQNGETVFVDADGDGALDALEQNVTVNQMVKVGMGHAYRASVGRVKWSYQDVDDEDGDLNTTEILTRVKWVAYVATGYLNIAQDHGGINVLAFDLVTGDMLWHFSDEYLSSVNDIPGAVTLVDTTGNNLVDRLYVGDMDGRLWELDAVDGSNPNGTVDVEGVAKQVPLWNAGVGKPISVSPAIVRDGGHVILVFGTGGADWAANGDTYSIYAVDATEKPTDPTYDGGAGTLLWQFPLATGEKVWSSPTIAAGRVFVATASGTMESDNPRKDIAGAGKLYSLKLTDGAEAWSMDIGKARGSIYVDRRHVYLTTIDNQLIQIGEDSFPTEEANNVVLKAWRELFW